MTVYIVVVNHEVDQVFSTLEAAENYISNYNFRFSYVDIVERQVQGDDNA